MDEAHDEITQRLDTRLDNLSERVAWIEGKQAAAQLLSPRKLIADYGGIVALCLSILTGGFTLYDKFVLDPSRARLQAGIELRKDMNQLANITASIAGLNWSNVQAATAQANSWTPQRLALLDKITLSDKTTPGILKFADRLAISNEYEAFGRLDEALNQIAIAHKDASDITQRANTYWADARLNGKQKNLSRMRELYTKAIDQFKSGGISNTAFVILQTYTQWIALELANGDCGSAVESNQRMIKDMASSDVWPATRIEIGRQFNAKLAQSPRTCGLARLTETE